MPTLSIDAPEVVREGFPLELVCTPSDPNVRVIWLLFTDPESDPRFITGDRIEEGITLSPPEFNRRYVYVQITT